MRGCARHRSGNAHPSTLAAARKKPQPIWPRPDRDRTTGTTLDRFAGMPLHVPHGTRPCNLVTTLP